MKVIIAGGRDFDDYEFLKREMDKIAQTMEITEVVCGGARGADWLGSKWAQERNIWVTYFPAEWGKYGKSAGFIRNGKMGEYADYLVAFWDGQSKGTRHMIDYMKRIGKNGTVTKYVKNLL